MGKYDAFKLRHSATGSDHRDAQMQGNVALVNAKFADSLGFRIVAVDGVSTDAVLEFGKTQDDRFILFRPLATVIRGSIVGVGTDRWLIIDVEQNELYPKATVSRCNYLVKWETYQSLAVVTAKARAYGLEQNQFIDLPRGEYSLLLPYNASTRLIKEDTRFVINGGAYSVIGYDNITHVLDGIGVVTVHIKDDLDRCADDLTDGGLAEQIPAGGWNNW